MHRAVICFAAFLASCFPALAQIAAAPQSDAPVSAAATTTSPEVQQFQKIEDAWSNAVNRHDQYALENVLSPLFMDVAANGDITTRNQQIALLLTNDDKSLWLSQKVVLVRMLGDTAVASGTYTLRHHVGSQTVDDKGVFTQVFERQHDRWVCLNSQRTVLPQDGPGKQKKPSNAAEAFHIPFFSK
jgi:ketosteroid isomerase-like protein